MKIIQISSASSSHSVKDYEKDIFKAWSTKVGFHIKKYNPNLDVEYWAIERKPLKSKLINQGGIKLRIFPTKISFRHGMEISSDLITSLKEEINKSIRDNYNLIIHIHEYHTWLAYQILSNIKQSNNLKIICQHHGGRSPLENIKKYKKLYLFSPIFLIMQIIEKRIFKKVDFFYALNDNEISYLNKISPNSKIRFQTMGIEEVYFKKINKKTAKKKLGLDLNKKYLLYIGRIVENKGIRELLNSMSKLQNKNLELLLIGQDDKDYESCAKLKNIRNVKFLGVIYGNEKLKYLSACDYLVLPSYTEGAPVVLMEAIAKNTPVIATNVGGISKMIKNGREGIIIKPKSSKEIIKAINNILTWKSKNIRNYAEKYKWGKIIKDTLKDYQK